jgi:hypothetical protein
MPNILIQRLVRKDLEASAPLMELAVDLTHYATLVRGYQH